MRTSLLILLVLTRLFLILGTPYLQAQTTTLQMPGDALRQQNELNLLVAENQGSPADFIRALEGFLIKYPATPQKTAIDKQLAQLAVQANDSPRILLYGEKVLAAPPEDLGLLDRVFRVLADRSDPESLAKSLAYAKRYQAGIALLSAKPQPHTTPGQWAEQIDRAKARSHALEAHALGSAGRFEDALAAARNSWAAYPTAEGAREVGNWLIKLQRVPEAIEFHTNAFAVEDPGSTEADHVADRKRLGELYTALNNGSEKGLGDLILAAWDRTRKLMRDRAEVIRATDPNALATEVSDFVLPSGDGAPPLALKTLKGKTVVMDFWATWCIPCRAQHPIIEKVKKRYEASPDIVFLAVDTDDDPSVVKPFMKEQGWTDPIWLEGGLQRRLTINSIPTVLILDSAGQVSSRLTGMIPEHFEDLLVERIEGARGRQAP